MKNCVVRTYKRGYTATMENLMDKLHDGWIVKLATPYNIDGTVEYVEYILEKED